MNPITEYVIEAVGRGWHVFPLKPHSKQPDSAHGQNDASDDLAVALPWFAGSRQLNYGIHCRPSGLYVIDIDDGAGKAGSANWRALLDEAGQTETATYEVATPNGGRHLVYSLDYEAHPLTNTASKLAEHVDTRGNGYVVGAGSKIGEREYRLVNDVDPAPLPGWLIERLTPSRPAVLVQTGPLASGDEVMTRLASLADDLRNASDGAGNTVAARVAYMAGQYVGAGQLDQIVAESVLTEAVAGWTWRNDGDFMAMNRTIVAQVRAGMLKPRVWAARSAPDMTARPAAPDAPAAAEAVVTPPADGASAERAPISMWNTEAGQGRYMSEQRPNYLYVIGIGWHRWDKRRWLLVDEKVVLQAARAVYAREFQAAANQWIITGDDRHEARARLFKQYMTASKLVAILKEWSIVPGVLREARILDAHPDLLNTPDGVVDLRSGKLAPHDPDLFLTKITTGRYRPGYRHPDWETARASLPEDVAQYLQLRIGQAASGRIPDSDDLLVLTGHGANGKSSWTTDGVFPALGDYAHLASPNLIASGKDGGGASPERASLRGTRFVLIEELPEGRSLNVAEVKRITGTSKITARFLYQQDITFDASHTLFVTSNYLPVVNETDDGTWRRLCRIEFPYRFRTRVEDANDRPGDAGLKARLRAGQDGQHDAILTWIVEGAQRFYSDPAAIGQERRPAAIAEATLDWRRQADRILGFVIERLRGATNGMVAKADVYTAFCAWLHASGHGKWSQETFWQRFLKHEKVREYRPQEMQTKNVQGISRPDEASHLGSDFVFELPKRPRVITGLEWLGKDE